MGPHGVLSGNEEQYLAEAFRTVRPQAWPAASNLLGGFPHAMVFNTLMGHAVDALGFSGAQALGRALAIVLYCVALARLFVVLGLSAADLLFVLVASFIHYLERLYDFGKEAGGFVAGNEKLLATIVWPHFWAIQIILLVMIFNYCVIRELGRVLGEDRMIRLFFRQPPGELLRGLEGPPGVHPASRRP